MLAGELDTLKLSTLRMTLAEKIETLGTLDEIANLLEDEGALAEDIEQSEEYKQKIYAVIDKAIAPAPPTPRPCFYLERTARDAISGLTLTAANYKEAVEILQKRFGSRQQIISKHMDILLNLDPVVKALRHLELTWRRMAVCFLLCCSASCHQTYVS